MLQARLARRCQVHLDPTLVVTTLPASYPPCRFALSLCDSLREGFMEDKAIIEAQQKLFDVGAERNLSSSRR
jgi:hypothetical protein